MPRRRPVLERFWEKVDKSGECWLWTGASAGYEGRGYFHLGRGFARKWVYAHRFSWELANGQAVPAGSVVCHSCDVPTCVRPEHLFLGTQGDNVRDCWAKGRNQPRKGQQNPCTALSDDDVREIRRLRANGVSGVKVAAMYGLSPSAISKIVVCVNWSHLE